MVCGRDSAMLTGFQWSYDVMTSIFVKSATAGSPRYPRSCQHCNVWLRRVGFCLRGCLLPVPTKNRGRQTGSSTIPTIQTSILSGHCQRISPLCAHAAPEPPAEDNFVVLWEVGGSADITHLNMVLECISKINRLTLLFKITQ